MSCYGKSADSSPRQVRAVNSEIVKALLTEAERNVETGHKMVERQRCIIKEMERDGLDTSRARSVLHELLNTQSLHLLTRDRLLGLLTE